jgi:hypothetical protein
MKTRSKICVSDWNGDGKLDLLVGDYATQKTNQPHPTPKQKAEHDRLQLEMQTVQKRRNELAAQLNGPKRLKDKNKREPLESEMNAIGQRISELYKLLPSDNETHGWVWLFLRQTAEAKNVGR